MHLQEPEILLKLQGGLGNLMFQIAGIKSFEQFTGKSVGFTNFMPQAEEYCKIGRDLFPEYKNTILSPVGEMDFNNTIERNYFEEPEGGYDDLGFLLNENQAFLNCYLQNHNLFFSTAFVKKLFNLNTIKIQEDFEDLQKHTSVSLHVRRTDYTGIQHILPCQTIEYYTNAVKEIGHYDYLLIFSDDPKWCENNLNFKNRIIVQSNELESLKIMSLCDKHKIANSTFSWWGAFLADPSLVIMPKQWFGPAVKSRPENHYKLDNWVAI